MATFIKEPGEELDYGWNWGAKYLKAGETIAESEWTVDDEDLVIDSQDHTDTVSRVDLSGGTLDTDVRLKNTIVTSGGRTAVRSHWVLVRVR